MNLNGNGFVHYKIASVNTEKLIKHFNHISGCPERDNIQPALTRRGELSIGVPDMSREGEVIRFDAFMLTV